MKKHITIYKGENMDVVITESVRVPNTSIEKDMKIKSPKDPQKDLEIWEHLKDKHCGKENAITMGELEIKFYGEKRGTSERVRERIKELQICYGKPVLTCRTGAFVCRTIEERDECAAAHEGRALKELLDAKIIKRMQPVPKTKDEGNLFPEAAFETQPKLKKEIKTQGRGY